jgi:hypothetical protein
MSDLNVAARAFVLQAVRHCTLPHDALFLAQVQQAMHAAR